MNFFHKICKLSKDRYYLCIFKEKFTFAKTEKVSRRDLFDVHIFQVTFIRDKIVLILALSLDRFKFVGNYS